MRLRRPRGGFTLLEFLVFAVLVLLVSTFALPRALEPRLALAEEQGLGYLGMVLNAERAWQRLSGEAVPLGRLAVEAPPAPLGSPNLHRVLFPPALIVDAAGIGHRGGYRYRLVRSEGRWIGCWAWPSLPGYSGRRTYYADFGSARIHEWKGELESGGPPQGPPAPARLGPPLTPGR